MAQGRIEIEDKIEAGIVDKLNSLPECISEWYYVMKAKGNTVKSCRDYLQKIEHFYNVMNLFDTEVDEITINDLSKYFAIIQYKENNGNKTKTSGSYLNSVWFALNNYFEYQVEVGRVDKNFMKLVKPAKNKGNIDGKKKPLLTANDFKKMLCHIPGDNTVLVKRNKAILLIYMNTGMRRDALCQMNINDLDFDNHLLTVSDKGEKEHVYVMNEEVETATKDWLDNRKYIRNSVPNALFVTYQGKRMTGNSVYNMITECSEKALGKAISPHKLRSGLCSILYEQTHDIEFVRKAIGHKGIATTQRYIVTDGNERKEVADIMSKLL